jgi:formamidopyrimidine-DNA glycosylase
MPELPEVEVIRLRLRETVLHRKIARLCLSENNYVFLTKPAQLRSRLVGQKFTRIDRRGKYLLFALDDASRLMIHLGMTGQLFLSRAMSRRLAKRSPQLQAPYARPFPFVPDVHTHVTFSFCDQGEELHFRDCRKFGKILWLPADASSSRLDRLGPDALTITAKELSTIAAGRRIAIKSLLLNQSALAGIGNIYADEALHWARVAPTRPAKDLAPAEIASLARSIRRLLRRAIALGGSSIDDYVHPDGTDGHFQKTFAAYGRSGEPCRRCHSPIQRVVIGQRSAHYCAKCQT